MQFPRQPRGGVRPVPGGSGTPLPRAVPSSLTTWRWKLAAGSGLAACGWGRKARLVWGYSLPGGPSWLCAEQTFRPDVGNMRNQFWGSSAAKPSTFGREAGSWGLSVSHLENERHSLGMGAPWSAQNWRLGQLLKACALLGRPREIALGLDYHFIFLWSIYYVPSIHLHIPCVSYLIHTSNLRKDQPSQMPWIWVCKRVTKVSLESTTDGELIQISCPKWEV